MSKLISANFSRLWKSRVFWVLEGISALVGMIFYGLAVMNTRNIGTDWYLGNGNYYFFLGVIYIGLVMAVFCSFYVGTEYADGTLRNKLVVGHSRGEIYLSNLVVVFVAGLLFTMTHIVASLCVGLPFLGGLIWESLAPVGWRMVGCVILILCYGTIFTFFAMLDGSKSRNVIVSFSLALAIILAGLFITGRLQEPEFISRMVMQEDGSFLRQDGIPNDLYISGTTRTIYTFIDAVLPSSQAFRIVRREGQFSILSIACLLGVSSAFTGVGVASFKKKDIK